jgi:hypothetical protein
MMWNPCPPTPGPGLFAQLVLSVENVGLALALIVLIVAGVYFVLRAKRWRREELDPPTVQDELAGYQHLQEQGLLQPNELERIKARLNANPQESTPPSHPVQAPDPPSADPPPDRGDPPQG